MLRIRMLVSYDGTEFCGYQRQNHGPQPSVQQTLEEALAKIFDQKVVLFASGRTDAGVHAIGQVCHFDVDVPESRFKNWDFCWALNSQLPDSIVPKKAWIAPNDFHATLSATHKIYRYYHLNTPRQSPFLRKAAGWDRKPIDIKHLQASSNFLLGKHDFKSFQSVGTPVHHTVREIFRAEWEWRTKNLLRFTIEGEGFLKQMVRNIVGTQLLLERKGEDPARIKEILAAMDRKKAGPPAPPQGLYLWKVFYPRELNERCRPI